ncbi:MAG: 3-dehydroquinate synthase [Pirellulales bacterium]|nr:3-dehydroquinate synthase [Pirellulales bacterium]
MTKPIQTVRVELGPRSYNIEIGIGNLAEVGPLLTDLGPVSHAVVVTDTNVERPHAVAVAESLAGEDLAVDLVAMEPGEPTKSIDMAMSLWEGLVELGADRKTVIVAVGGGVVGDLAGFVAATFARGVRFLQVPTSLLAQVDSSVGGKVGINLPQAKNMVGAFLQPVGVLVDAATLATLPEREYRSGLAEVVKYGVILDAVLFDQLEANAAGLLARQDDLLIDVIAQCCRLKADIVRRDEHETTGLRAVLNYGHTFGHAVETLSGYGELLHGEAVAMGMVCATRLAERLGRIGPDVTRRQRDLLAVLGLPIELPPLDPDQVFQAMQRDKKSQHGRLHFVLPDRLGHVALVSDLAPADVRAVLGE